MPKAWNLFEGCNIRAGTDEPANIKCLEAVFANLISVLVMLVPLAIFVMFTIAGFKWLTSAGDAKKIEAAQKTLFYAIVGVVLMILSYIILLAIKWFTGVDVLKFNIPT